MTIKTYRCNQCGEPCILISSDDDKKPDVCPYSFVLITKASFEELK